MRHLNKQTLYLLPLFILVVLSACQENNDSLPVKKTYTHLYWTSIRTHAILHAMLNTETDSLITIDTVFNAIDGLLSPSAVVIDPTSQMLYWTDYATQQIVRGDWNGQRAPQILYTIPQTSNGPIELALDAESGYLYWTQPYEDLILRAPTNGAGPVDTLFSQTNINGPWGISIQVNQQNLYWIEYGNIELHRGSLRDNTDKILYAGGSGFLRPYGLAMNNTDIFILDNVIPGSGQPDRILKGSTNGAPLFNLYSTGVSNAYNLAIDPVTNSLYWLNQLDQGSIWKGSADGTAEPREIITGIPLGEGLAVVTITKIKTQ